MYPNYGQIYIFVESEICFVTRFLLNVQFRFHCKSCRRIHALYNINTSTNRRNLVRSGNILPAPENSERWTCYINREHRDGEKQENVKIIKKTSWGWPSLLTIGILNQSWEIMKLIETIIIDIINSWGIKELNSDYLDQETMRATKRPWDDEVWSENQL